MSYRTALRVSITDFVLPRRGLDGAKPISAERACALFEEVTGAGETEPRLSSTNRETPIVFDEFVRFFAALAEVVFVHAAPTAPRARGTCSRF